ncbi:unnamed protein product [Laminaria digitata]
MNGYLRIQLWSPSIVPGCASQQYRHHSGKPALLRTLPHWLIPSVPSDLTGTIAGSRHYSTGTIEGPLLYVESSTELRTGSVFVPPRNATQDTTTAVWKSPSVMVNQPRGENKKHVFFLFWVYVRSCVIFVGGYFAESPRGRAKWCIRIVGDARSGVVVYSYCVERNRRRRANVFIKIEKRQL